MDKHNKKIVIGAGVVTALTLLLVALSKGEAAPPPSPGKANLYGKVTDALTGKPIEGIEVSCAEFVSVTETNGYYLIEDIIPGGYEVTFSDPLGRYESAVF